MERFFRDSKTIQRYRSSPLGSYIDRLAARMHEQKYCRDQALRHFLTVEEFGRWLQRLNIPLREVTFAHVRKYVRFRGHRKRGGALLALKRLLETLAREGHISPMDTPRSLAELEVHNFGNYLREERALARRTINNRKTLVTGFLAQRFSNRSFQFSDINAEDLIAFVQKEAVRRRNSIKSVPVRYVGEQHVKEDLGRIPTTQDWLSQIKPAGWMYGQRLEQPDSEHHL
jgi:hypothetical protein